VEGPFVPHLLDPPAGRHLCTAGLQEKVQQFGVKTLERDFPTENVVGVLKTESLMLKSKKKCSK